MLVPSPLRDVVSTDEGVLRAYAGSRGPVWCLPRAVARPRDAGDIAPSLAWAAGAGAMASALDGRARAHGRWLPALSDQAPPDGFAVGPDLPFPAPAGRAP